LTHDVEPRISDQPRPFHTMRSRFIRLLTPGAAFSLGLRIRLVIILGFLLLGAYNNPETWENGTIASYIWNGEGFSAAWGGVPEPTSYQAPVYPYLLCAVWRVFGQRPAAYLFLALLQSLAVCSMIFPIHKLTRHWFGDLPAIIAAWACALSPVFLWFPARMHHTALVMGFHPWLVLGWVTLTDDWNRPMSEPGNATPQSARRRALFAIGVGALTGFAGLTQPVLLPVYGLFALLCIITQLVQRRSREAVRVLVAGAATLLVLTPWTIRNYRVHGRLILVKNGFGKEFWMGNNPFSNGTSFADGGEVEITIQHPPKAFARRGELSEMELMDALEAEAMEYIRAEPGAFVDRTAHKILWFWTFPPERVARSYGRATMFVHSIHNAYWMAFLALALLAAWTRRIPRQYVVILVMYVVVYSVAYGLIHVGQPRYRGEIESIFLPLVGAGAAWVLERLRPGTSNALASTATAKQRSPMLPV